MNENLSSPHDPDISHIKRMISELSTVNNENLQTAMDDLKRALMENPAASSLLLPEDIGEIVKHYKTMTGKMIIQSKVKASTSKKNGAKHVPSADFLKQMEDQI